MIKYKIEYLVPEYKEDDQIGYGKISSHGMRLESVTLIGNVSNYGDGILTFLDDRNLYHYYSLQLLVRMIPV